MTSEERKFSTSHGNLIQNSETKKNIGIKFSDPITIKAKPITFELLKQPENVDASETSITHVPDDHDCLRLLQCELESIGTKMRSDVQQQILDHLLQ